MPGPPPVQAPTSYEEILRGLARFPTLRVTGDPRRPDISGRIPIAPHMALGFEGKPDFERKKMQAILSLVGGF
jgi:hypothetical protein